MYDFQFHSSHPQQVKRINCQPSTRTIHQSCKPDFGGPQGHTTATIIATSLIPKFLAILALTTARKLMKKTLRPRKIADTMITVGPCDAATAVVVAGVVVDISYASLQYSYTEKIQKQKRNNKRCNEYPLESRIQPAIYPLRRSLNCGEWFPFIWCKPFIRCFASISRRQ
jgi:hypothetical protein